MKCLLGTSEGTDCELEKPFGNLVGTHWEHKKPKQPLSSSPLTLKKKLKRKIPKPP
jgi:hypothetical protein